MGDRRVDRNHKIEVRDASRGLSKIGLIRGVVDQVRKRVAGKFAGSIQLQTEEAHTRHRG